MSATRFSRGTSAWIVMPGSKMYPPPLDISRFKRCTSRRTWSAVPETSKSCVETPPQKVRCLPNSFLEKQDVHGFRLDGVEDVEPQVDQVADDRHDIPARMVKDRKAMALGRAVDPHQAGLQETSPMLGRHEHAALRTVIVAYGNALEPARRRHDADRLQNVLGQSVQQVPPRTTGSSPRPRGSLPCRA